MQKCCDNDYYELLQTWLGHPRIYSEIDAVNFGYELDECLATCIFRGSIKILKILLDFSPQLTNYFYETYKVSA